MGDGGDDEAVGADAVEDGIGGAADDEFTDAGFRADAAEIRMNSQSFNDRNDARGQACSQVPERIPRLGRRTRPLSRAIAAASVLGI